MPVLRNLAALLLLSSVALPGVAADDALSVELNKLEQREDACRAYMVIRNSSEAPYDAFKLDLVFFDQQGVIISRLLFNAAPLHAGKLHVKLFDAVDVQCEQVSAMLLNDVAECSSAGTPVQGCLERIETSSRAGAELRF